MTSEVTPEEKEFIKKDIDTEAKTEPVENDQIVLEKEMRSVSKQDSSQEIQNKNDAEISTTMDTDESVEPIDWLHRNDNYVPGCRGQRTDWLDVCYRVYFKIIAEQKVPERGKSDVDVQTKGESKKIVHQEKDGEKKRKRAHEDDVITIEPDKVQLNDNDVKTPRIQKDKELMHPANNLLVLPQYNKPKKSNMAQVMPQDYECTPQDLEVIQYMKEKSQKHLLVRIGDCWGERNDMDCLFSGNEEVNGAHLLHREGGSVYLENTWFSQLLRGDGEQDESKLSYTQDDVVETRVQNYLDVDMVFLPINITKFHWYLAVVNASEGMERLIKHALLSTPLDQTKWKHGVEVSTWEIKHKITEQMQKDGCSCGLWLINYMEYWTGTALSDQISQRDISNFRYKLPAILYNSPLNEARGLPDDGDQYETDNIEDDDITELDDLDILMSGDIKLTRTLKWKSREDLLSAIYTIIHLIGIDETFDKDWIRSTRPYPISLGLTKIKNILNEDQEMDHECLNMAIRIAVCNQYMMLKKQKYHFMDLKFAEITRFGRDQRCCGKIDKEYHKKLRKVLECWPNMEYKIKDCSHILLPYYKDGTFILFILDMQNKTVFIMDPLQDETCLGGYNQKMAYIPTLHTIARRLGLAMGLTNAKWSGNIYKWKREYPLVTKVTYNNKYWKLGGFLVYNFMKLWNGKNLPQINSVSIYSL
ncbi:hypothetical protein BDA96_06G233500 [Sorghum bicolor]|uniref:Ubiquitin-like protease family profile domain-containing protein n=1 Tax=Sorghum bicolor TaxID=4558 RepID=A0A921QS49_SORBI|nr:hypothetical protein BDA96_06G233500 [Sorghum bicolor]